MITSGSFKKGWVVDVGPAVKGKPASGAGRRTTLDIGPYIDWERGMNHPEVTMSDTPPNSNLIAPARPSKPRDWLLTSQNGCRGGFFRWYLF